MEIAVEFADGRIREFNTSAYTASDPFTRRNPDDPSEEAIVTELDLRLDLLETEGLRLDIYTNTISRGQPEELNIVEALGHDGEKSTAQVATRHIYATVFLMSRAELANATNILVHRCGETTAVAWRQGSGSWLINGMRFASVARETYADSRVASNNAQLMNMMRRLGSVDGEVSPEELAEIVGFPYEAYLEAVSMGAGSERDKEGKASDVEQSPQQSAGSAIIESRTDGSDLEQDSIVDPDGDYEEDE